MVTIRAVRLFLILAVLMLGSIPAGMAQESDDLNFAYGKILKIAENKIVLLAYDYETNEEEEVTYNVNAETVFEDVGSVNDLRVNDEIDIEYAEVDGKKIIKNLYKVFISENGEETKAAVEEETEEAVEEVMEE